jgi:threonine/homoserine/homoserine lactone efflux protein
LHYITLFALTFLAAAVATLPPGLLNMNAAKISVERGKKFGIYFSLACSLVIFIEALGAAAFSKYLFEHPETINHILVGALLIFIVLFFYFWKKSNRDLTELAPSSSNSFLKGISLALLNVLTLPFYAGLHAALQSSKIARLATSETLVFATAALSGTFAILYGYAYGFAKISFDEQRFEKRSNRIIAGLMLLLVVFTFIRLWLNYE